MKYSKITPIIAALMLVATTAPVYAFDVDVKGNLDIKAQDGRMYKGSDDRKNDDRDDDNKKRPDPAVINPKMERENAFSGAIKSWIIDAGTVGQVTAVNGAVITISTPKAEVYTVTTTDATVRRGQAIVAASTIVVGDNVFVIGVKNGTSVVASTIIVGASQSQVQPTYEEKRQSFLGVISAKTDTTLTIVDAKNVSYTVTVVNAQIWINNEKQTSLTSFVVGDKVMVQGTLSGSTIAAKKVLVVHLPVGTVAGKITAVSGTTLTVLGVDSKTYSVVATNATIKAKGSASTPIANLVVGDTIVAKGDMNGTMLTATTITEERLEKRFFNRFGNFFKGIFGKK